MTNRKKIDPDLHRAVIGKDLDLVRDLVEQGADLEATDEYLRTALLIAVDSARRTNRVGYGIPEMIPLLLELGADPNAQDNDGVSALFPAVAQAITTEDLMARALLDAGADLGVKDRRGRTVLDIYERSPGYANAGLLFDEVRAGREPLHLLAERGEVGELQELLTAGHDPNQRDAHGYSVLAGAASANQPEAARLLLEQGADPNLRQGPNRIPLLNIAIAQRHDEVIAALVAGGADPDLKGDVGFTPREFADKVSQPYF